MLGFYLIIILFCNFPPWVTLEPEDFTTPTTKITPNPEHGGPGRPIWPGWLRGLSEEQLVKMTDEIVRDVVYKLKHAEKIRTSHGVSISFQLGSVAASIQEHFYHMLNMYRKYANTRDFKSDRWPIFDVFKAYEIILVLTPASNSLETPNMAPLMKEMTTGLITMLTNETKDYRPVSVRDIMNQTRRQLLANIDSTYHFGDNDELRKRACYSISTAYQNALMDLRRYFELRWLYVDNVEFEVGFVVHEIIHRYQMVLELYQMTERRFLPHENQNYAWSSYMLYIYVNILEQCKVIVHMCNMLHEIEAKYRRMKKKKAGVFDDYLDTKDYKGGRMNSTDLFAKDRLKLMIFEREQKKRQKMLAKERKKHRSAMLQLGKTTPRLKTRPTKHKFHDIIYGWSVETW